jgi:hypothetical protein
MAKKIVSKAKLATGAVVLLQQVLANEEVRKALANAPQNVMRWASKKRDEYKTSGATDRLNPVNRFGQKGLERRINSLFEVSASAFPARNDPGRAELLDAIDRMRLALGVAAEMPLAKRKRAQVKIGKQLDELEAAMVEAILPQSPKSIGSATTTPF